VWTPPAEKDFDMPILNAFSKAVTREFSLQELEQAARLMRGYDLVALCAAGSGHSGGTLSMMDIVSALYLKVANHDPNVPNGVIAIESSGPADTKLPHFISVWPSPVISPSRTSSRCASFTRPSRGIRTG